MWRVVTGDDAPGNGDFLPEHPGVAVGLVLWVLIAVLTPIAEELFFRGLMLRAIGRRWNLPIAVVVSSLVFGSFHFEAGNGIPHALFIVAVTASYGGRVRPAGRAGGRAARAVDRRPLVREHHRGDLALPHLSRATRGTPWVPHGVYSPHMETR